MKSEKKSHKKKDSIVDNSQIKVDHDREGSPEKPKKSTSRLRRRRDSFVQHASDSSLSDPKGRRERERRRRKKRSSRATTTTPTTEASSEWDAIKKQKEGKVDKKEKSKETTEKDLVKKMQDMIPYVTAASPLWTKWTLAPLYHFLRNPNASMVLALTVEVGSADMADELKGSRMLGQLLRICKPIEGRSLITFNRWIPGYTGQLFYFVKSHPVHLDGYNFEDEVAFGNIPPEQAQSFNMLLTQLWTPLLTQEEFLPDGLRGEVFTDLNDISVTTQTTVRALESNNLLLALPLEPLGQRGLLELSKDKEYCGRLEETVVYWLTKLKEAVILKELDDEDGRPGPLEEIKFWQFRSANLGQILDQLKSPLAKKIKGILSLSRSPYITQLDGIQAEVLECWKEASSNAHYLSRLLEPCTSMVRCKLKQVPDKAEAVLWLVVAIWRNAPYYNSSGRANGLLRKVSNSIIAQCRKRIQIGRLLEGHVASSEAMLLTCLSCLSWWRGKYKSTEEMYVAKGHHPPWGFDYDQIFTQVDAMSQRVNDLMEICNVVRLYGRKSDGVTSPLPLYPGTKGPYMTQVMSTVEQVLHSKLQEVGQVTHLILDVYNTQWHFHMDNFREAALSIELAIQNLLEDVFDQMTNLKERLELLQIFHKFYERAIITRQIDKLSIRAVEYFEQEILKLRRLFEQRVIPLPLTYSNLAGRSSWAIYMKQRVEAGLDLLEKAEPYLTKSKFAESVKSEGRSFAEAMYTFAKKTYDEWTGKTVESKEYQSKLDIPLLIRDGRSKKSTVQVNFDRAMFTQLVEAETWARVGRAVPPTLLLSIYPLRDKLNMTRENAAVVTKSYNSLVSGLSRDERLLFREQLTPLEKKIYPCLSSFIWSADPATSSTTADHVFVDEFQRLANGAWTSITAYRNANRRVAQLAHKMSRRLMVKLKPKAVYDCDLFRATQNREIEKQVKRIVRDYKSIVKVLKALFAAEFQDCGPEVRVQWGKYVNLIDDCVQEALSISLRATLESLEKTVSSSQNPLFKVDMTLDGSKVGFQPDLQTMTEVIMGVHRRISMSLEPLSKISKFLHDSCPDQGGVVLPTASFTPALLADQFALETQDRLKLSIEKCLSEVSLYAERWGPYRDIWELDRGAFADTYDKTAPISAIEKDLTKYLEVANVVVGSESVVSVRFLTVDCTTLKTCVSQRSSDWFNQLAKNLARKAKSALTGLYDYMDKVQIQFSTPPPQTIAEQVEVVEVFDAVKAEAEEKAGTFPAITGWFGLLQKYNYELEPDVKSLIQGLETSWKRFVTFLKGVDNRLQNSHERLRSGFLKQRAEFNRTVTELGVKFEREAPFSSRASVSSESNAGCDKALELLRQFDAETGTLAEEESRLLSSLKFFTILEECAQGLIELTMEIESLGQVWKKVHEWETHWTKWRQIPVPELRPEFMNTVAEDFLQAFKTLDKQFETKSWPVISETIETLEAFQGCCQTVNLFQNARLRDWHWDKLQRILGPNFDPATASFTLETVVSLKLHLFTEEIAEISVSSGKEAAVERSLTRIESFWEEKEFTLVHRKEAMVPIEVCVSPSLKDALMDHIVSISAMKGSQFTAPFQEQIDGWEKTLEKTRDILESLLETQLELLGFADVFSSGDVCKEVPGQAKQFSCASSIWASIILIITENRRVIALSETENLDEILSRLGEHLERLRKNMEILLEAKRQEFPRFYFVPDQDLLECIGNSGRPGQLIRVVRKLFSNLDNFLGSDQEIFGIVSKEGEQLDLVKPVPVLGPVESWLENLENCLKCAVIFNIENSVEALQEKNVQLGEWATRWPAQSCLTAVQVQWTLDVSRAFHRDPSEKGVHVGEFTLKKISKRLKRENAKLMEKYNVQKGHEELLIGDKLKLDMLIMTLFYLRDVTERLYMRNCTSSTSFEWLQFLRFYWEKDSQECVVRQAHWGTLYGCEYLGVLERAVITPLTERAFLSLTTATSFHFGGLLQGGENAGKMETIKELARQLGLHTVNLCLSGETDYKGLSSILIGLVQTGSWGIFRNVESCPPEITSFLSSRLENIIKAKCRNVKVMMLSGLEVRLEMNSGVFVILQSSGCKTVPELSSLRAVLRPIAMVQPDTSHILDVRLFIAGFANSTSLARKLHTLFVTASALFCSQTRCKFSLEGILSVVKAATTLKHLYGKQISEAEAIVKSLQSIVVPALEPQEQLTLATLTTDIFGPDDPVKLEDIQIKDSIRKTYRSMKYPASEESVKCCYNLHEILQSHKSVVLVGNSGTGKTTVRRLLKMALVERNKEFDLNLPEEEYKEHVINPCTLDPSELFGKNDPESGKWRDGILTKFLKTASTLPDRVKTWIVFDGPMIANWFAEAMSGMLDKKGVLTLANSDRIPVPEQVSFFFETDSLESASPGMICKIGVICFREGACSTWKNVLEAWANNVANDTIKENLPDVLTVWMDKCIKFRSEHCSIHVPSLSEHTMVAMFVSLMDTFIGIPSFEHMCSENVEKACFLLKQITLFCMTWSVLGDPQEDSKHKASAFLKDFDPHVFPSKGTVYDYFMNMESFKWAKWNVRPDVGRLDNWRFVPTIDTVRTEYFLTRFQGRRPVILVGHPDSGKSKIIRSTFQPNFSKSANALYLQMTPMMKANCLQSLIQSRLEPISSFVLSPPRGKSLVVCIDDLNAAEDGNSSYCEFLRNTIEHRVWYDRGSGVPTAVSNMTVVSAMTLGRRAIPPRLQSKFAVIYVPKPDEFQFRKIFTSIANRVVSGFPAAVKLLADSITVATLEIYKLISTQLLPSPSKPIHIFSYQDISRVYDGLARANNGIQDTKLCCLRLWLHECFRVFQDRLMSASSRLKVRDILAEQAQKHFELPMQLLQPSGSWLIYGNFLPPRKGYEEIRDYDKVKGFLSKLVMKSGGRATNRRNTILFKEGIEQLAKIARAISAPQGHAIIVGDNGQGRQTLSRLAASLYNYLILEPSTEPDIPVNTLVAPLRNAIYSSGCNKGCCLILKDENISEETLELVSMITSSAEIPQMFNKLELQNLKSSQAPPHCNDTASLLDVVRDKIEQNLHVILCIKPSGKQFGNLVKYSTLMKRMAVMWTNIWLPASYLEVAKSLMSTSVELADPVASGSIFYSFHAITDQAGRNGGISASSSITSTHFMDFVEQYGLLTTEMSTSRAEKIKLLKRAIEEISVVRGKIGYLTERARTAEGKAETSRKECETLHKVLQKQKFEMEMQTAIVNENNSQLEAEEKSYEELAELIKSEWTSALEDFETSASVVQDLMEDDLTHLRSYYSAPPLVSKVLDAVMILLDRETTWAEAKLQLGHPDFTRNLWILNDDDGEQIVEFDKGRVTTDKLNQLKKFIQNKEFTPEAVAKYSNGARILCTWVHALDNYGRAFLTKILPKRAKLKESEGSIEEVRNVVEMATAKLQLFRENLAETQGSFNTKIHLKEDLELESSKCAQVLSRAQSVLNLLEEDTQTWNRTVSELEREIETLSGDSLMTAAYLTYLGPFDGELRKEIANLWMQQLQKSGNEESGIKISKGWNLSKFLGCSFLHIEMEVGALPTSNHLLESIIIIQRSLSPVLIIDPHEMAFGWLTSKKNGSDRTNGSKIVVLKSGSQTLSSQVLNAYSEFLDELARRNVENNYERKGLPKLILITTQIHPKLKPNLSSRFTIVNFAISPKDLEDYLNGKLALIGNPEMESSLKNQWKNVLAEEHRIYNLKQQIIQLIISNSTSILSSEEFPKVLSGWQAEIESGKAKLAAANQELHDFISKQKRIRPVAARLTMVFSSICEMSRISPLYASSLHVFCKQLETFGDSVSQLQSRRRNSHELTTITSNMMLSLFRLLRIPSRLQCRSMFSRDRYVLALILSTKILQEDGQVDGAELNCFTNLSNCDFYEGSIPCNEYPEFGSWITRKQLAGLQALDKLEKFKGLLQSMRAKESNWETWVKYFEPETKIPKDWEHLGCFQKLLLLAILRPDRIPAQIKVLAEQVLGKEFSECVETTLINLEQVVSSTTPDLPVIFLREDNGAPEPLPSLQSLATIISKASQKVVSLQLSKHNTSLAEKLMQDGMRNGYWVYLSHCELAVDWIPLRLEEIMKIFRNESPVHTNYRLWLSTKVHPLLPHEILRSAIKIAVEPPATLQLSMSRLYSKLPPSLSGFSADSTQPATPMKQLLFALSFFHCGLVGRSKFQPNKVLSAPHSPFQDCDFEIGAAILRAFVTNYDKIPWWALKYMLELQYTSHFDSRWDHQVLLTLLNGIFREDAILVDHFQLSATTPTLRMPPLSLSLRGELSATYHKFLMTNYPREDNPEMYGIDASVGLTRNTCQADQMLQSAQQILTKYAEERSNSQQKTGIQDRHGMTMMGQDRLDMVRRKVDDLLKALPHPMDEYSLRLKLLEKNSSQPLSYVLLTEVKRFNELLRNVRISLEHLHDILSGQSLMPSEAEKNLEDISCDIVPRPWRISNAHAKDLGSWIKDVQAVTQQIQALTLEPTFANVELGRFFHPKAFLTALLQKASRDRGVPIDQLCWRSKVLKSEMKPKQSGDGGTCVHGLHLVGAGWDLENCCLQDCNPLEQMTTLPPISLEPVKIPERATTEYYKAPCFQLQYPMTPTWPLNSSQPVQVITIDLDPGMENVNHWILRGVTILLNH